METTTNHFFRDMGITLGRSLRPVLRSRDVVITVALILLPLVVAVLLVRAVGGILQTVESLFFTIISEKRKY